MPWLQRTVHRYRRAGAGWMHLVRLASFCAPRAAFYVSRRGLLSRVARLSVFSRAQRARCAWMDRSIDLHFVLCKPRYVSSLRFGRPIVPTHSRGPWLSRTRCIVPTLYLFNHFLNANGILNGIRSARRARGRGPNSSCSWARCPGRERTLLRTTRPRPPSAPCRATRPRPTDGLAIWLSFLTKYLRYV